MTRAIDILRSDDTLMGAYILRVAGRAAAPQLTEETAARFLLWFAFEGRHEHQQVCFSADYLGFLSDPIPPYVSRLAGYVLLRRDDIRRTFGADVDSFNAWYYLVGVDEHRLGPLVSARERLALHAVNGDDGDAAVSTVARYVHRLDQNLQDAYDLSRSVDRAAYRAWFETRRRPYLAPWLRIAPMTDPLGARGVNVFGFVDGVLGIGEDVRALANALLRAGIPMAIHGLDLADRFATSESHGWHSLTCGRPLFPVSVFCLPPFETLRVRIEHGSHLFDGRHNIGYWPWELTSLPKELHGIFSLVDEVWSSSGFLTGVYTKLTEKPVRHMPPYLNLPKPTRIERADFGIGADDFVVLVMFDFNSFTARKNPEGAIAAFRAAFADMSGSECLVVKTLNGHAHPEAFEALKADLLQDPRMVLIDGPLSREETAGLIELADVYVSLHRSEGFGRILAEAMLLGTPVVATDWSGSKDFLNEDTGWPVAFVLRDVLPHEYIYASGSRWAEPSVEDATKQLKAVRTSPAEARRRAAAGRRRVEAVHSLDAVARAVSRRLLPPTATGALAGTRTNGAGPQPVRTSAPGDAPPAVRVHRPTKPAG